jgi:hypothetical protein
MNSKVPDVFTKLDLCLGYHQIQMKEAIFRRVILEHEGNYELLVTPFGICNAPFTFQSLMNKLLKPYLQKFVLFFFYDILIYNHTWDSHLLHVENFLQLLQENQLFVKKTKCSFGASEVEYVGHIVNQDLTSTKPLWLNHILLALV